MCGIVFTFSNGGIGKASCNFFEQGLYADALRGMDSTGIIAVRDDTGEAEVFKKAYPAADFLDLKSTRAILDNSLQYNCMVGHNRWATKGAVIHKNSHPFNHGKITGVHNGSLWSQTTLPDNHKFPVDSDNIFYSIEQIGVEETIKKLDGAFALVWHDSDSNTLNFIRNDKRPLHFAYTEDYNTIIGASEPDMIKWLAVRNKITIMDDYIYDTEVGDLYQFDLGSNDCTAYTQESLELFKFNTTPPLNNNRSGAGYWNDYGLYDEKEDDFLPAYKGSRNISPPSTERESRKEERLKKLGLGIGDPVTLRLSQFVEYQNSTRKGRGYYKGYSTTSPFFNVKIYGVSEDTFNIGEIYKGNVISVTGWGNSSIKEKDMSVVIDTSSIVPLMNASNDEVGSNVLSLPSPDDDDDLDDELGVKHYEFLSGPRNTYIPKKDWEELTKFGCCQCQGNIEEEYHDKVLWTGEYNSSPMCHHCVEMWDNMADGYKYRGV